MSILKDTSPLEKKLKLNFTNKSLITQALVHRSYLNENRKFPISHNERLEFLGDAVLELVVTEYLFKKYDYPEGELTNLRASLVNSHMLSQITHELDVEPLLYLSKGEANDKSVKARDQILANVFEAITGAIYLEFGYQGAQKFIHERLLTRVEYILANKLFIDPKTKFQEIAQEKEGVTPHYKVLKETGPDHNKHFIIGLYLDEELVAQGEGCSKQEGQIAAAEAGLKIKKWN